MISKTQPSTMCPSTISTSAWWRRDFSHQISCHSQHLSQLLLSSLRLCTTCHSQPMQRSPPPTWFLLLRLLFWPRLPASSIPPMPCRQLQLMLQCLRRYQCASILEWRIMQPEATSFPFQPLRIHALDFQESFSVRRNRS